MTNPCFQLEHTPSCRCTGPKCISYTITVLQYITDLFPLASHHCSLSLLYFFTSPVHIRAYNYTYYMYIPQHYANRQCNRCITSDLICSEMLYIMELWFPHGLFLCLDLALLHFHPHGHGRYCMFSFCLLLTLSFLFYRGILSVV